MGVLDANTGANTTQQGGFMCGHSLKKGVLGAATTRKKGNLELIL